MLAVTSATAQGATRVTEFKGTGNMTTAIFRVESLWVLDWRLDGDGARAGQVVDDGERPRERPGKHWERRNQTQHEREEACH